VEKHAEKQREYDTRGYESRRRLPSLLVGEEPEEKKEQKKRPMNLHVNVESAAYFE
jgi:hypothetical protein